MNVYVKYCGGCNPRYDREAFVNELKEGLPQHSFSAQAKDPDVSLIVCGCSCACADKSGCAAPYGMITVWQHLDVSDIKDRLDHFTTIINTKQEITQ
ncbi:MAG: hypothetical protein E7233_05195 [Lachnospiraceae bacterium]|nr:hypothetical protein [Lachnospiraceae bacterium]